MQSNIFWNVGPSLKEKKYNYKAVLNLLDEYYHSKDFIYPLAVSKYTEVQIKDVYEILEKCVEYQIINRIYGVYCHTCCHIANYYDNFISIPNNTFCEYCDNEIPNCFNKTVVIYKVK